MPTINFESARKVLIVTLEGGAGHFMAANCIEQEAKAAGLRVHRKDALANIGANQTIADSCARVWNDAQRNGAVRRQEQIFKNRWIVELTFAIPIFFKTLYLILRHKYDTLVDTQILGTQAMVHAVRVANAFNRIFNPLHPPIKMIKVMTDCPTKGAKHFFGGIKVLTKGDRKIFKLYASAKPLLAKGETEQEFWKNRCGLSLDKGQVQYCEPPIRPAYKTIMKDPNWRRPPFFDIKINNHEEFNLLSKKLHHSFKPSQKKDFIQYPIEQNDVIAMVQLGSQAAVTSTLNYVKSSIKDCKELCDPNKKYHLFVFCGSHKVGENTLLSKVHELINSSQITPNLNIIPLGFQDDLQSAPICASADKLFIRTGGITSAEVNAVAQGKIFMHSEIKKRIGNKNEPSQLELFAGAALWERGNAEWLKKMKNAKMITPKFMSRAFYTSSSERR